MPPPDTARLILRHVRGFIDRFGRAPLFLLLLWLLAVWWGEQSVFAGHVQDCAWPNWETWKPNAHPHRVLIVADPQLVDPHTYPDRPWPLSSLTVLYTDLYLKRAYRELLQQLQPDSTVFLGDLFDGGREWGTASYVSPEDQYKKYGQDFWLREYQRFQNMFVKTWLDSGIPHLPSNGGRRLLASVPGNHDLGFGGGINPYVKSRFDAHFGPLNRMDVIGNHTLVSLDTVSLSAMDQVDPETGAAGSGDGSGSSSRTGNIWKPVENYLENAKEHREKAIKHEIRRLGARSSFPELREAASRDKPKHIHASTDVASIIDTPDRRPHPLKIATSQFPTIILSHVPFYRNNDVDCGPHRERGTSIPISAGYQYQNVLTPLISKDIVDKLDASQIAMIYSGDDHDYCEIEHDRFTGRIKEITVKSMSWAMGIRKPGVQLVSLWNPVDLSAMISNGYSGPAPDQDERVLNMPKGTVQNRLCLLPDQLGIFIRYGELLAITFTVLLIRATLWQPKCPRSKHAENSSPLLPVHKSHSSIPNGHSKHMVSPALRPQSPSKPESTSSTANSSASSLTARKNGTLGGYGHIPMESRSRSTSPSKARFQADSDDWGMPTTASDRVVYARHHDPSYASQGQWVASQISNSWAFRRPRSKGAAFVQSVLFIAGPVLGFYFWLLWRDW